MMAASPSRTCRPEDIPSQLGTKFSAHAARKSPWLKANRSPLILSSTQGPSADDSHYRCLLPLVLHLCAYPSRRPAIDGMSRERLALVYTIGIYCLRSILR